MAERIYYRTHGKTKEKLESLHRQFAENDAAITRWAKVEGGDGYWHRNGLGGIAIAEGKDIPHGWRYVHTSADGNLFLAPNKRTKAGKNLALQMEELPPVPHSSHVSDAFGAGAFDFIENGRIGRCWLHSEKVGEEYILSVPVSNYSFTDEPPKQFTPPEATELKLSEYHALKEAQAALTPHAL